MAIRGIKKYEKTEKEKQSEKIRKAKEKAFGKRMTAGGVGIHWGPGTEVNPFKSGGKATHGYGKAYMKGGRAK